MRKIHLLTTGPGSFIGHVIRSASLLVLTFFLLNVFWIPVSAQTLKAVLFNPPNDPNYEYIEIKHTPSTPLTNVWFLYIDGDITQGGNPGEIQVALNLSAYTTGSNGLLLLNSGSSSLLPTPPSQTTVVNNVILELDNGSATFLLVKNFNGSVGFDLDMNNDGIMEFTRPWSNVLDAVSIFDNTSQNDKAYADDLNGTVLQDAVGAEADGFINQDGNYTVIELVHGAGTDPYGPFPVFKVWDKNGNVTFFGPQSSVLLLPGSPSFGALPIELVAFTGKRVGDAIELFWRTATEQNNDFMEVQRSKNGKTFETLSKIQSQAEVYSAKPLDYHYTDEHPLTGVNYYRLRQVDLDGKEEFHSIIAVLFKDQEDKTKGITLFPSVVIDQLNLALPEEARTEGDLYISDMSGRVRSQLTVERGMQQRSIPVQQLATGQYVLVVRIGRDVQTARFVKQ